MTVTDIHLPAELSARFRRFIAERSGLCFKEQDTRILEDAIRERAASCGLGSGDAYLLYLISRPGREEELREFLNLLTVGHTYFFRNGSHFEVLREKVLPEIVDRKRRNPPAGSGAPGIRIWSAGCSTGEEAYSIAMSVLDVVEDLREWDILIYATDISAGALDAARRGRYSRSAVRRVGAGHLERYFAREPGEAGAYRIEDAVRSMVQFDFLNLCEPPYPAGLDVIFCRNVLMYFRPDSIRGVIDNLHESLLPEGYLFMGGSESPQFFTDRFEMKIRGDAVYYRKAVRNPDGRGGGGEALRRRVDPGLMITRPSRRESREATVEAKCVAPAAQNGGVAGVIEEIRTCIHREEYARARLLVDEALRIDPASAEALCLAAEADTREGYLEAARERLEHVLQIDPFFAPAYCLFGLTSFEEGDYEGAKARLRKALYLDGDFPMARFLLGIIHEEEGRCAEAVREYRNTVEILGGGSSRGWLPCGGGFDAKTLAEISRAGIERLESRE